MTLDSIIQVAREVGFTIKVGDVDKFQLFAALIAAAEQGARAKVCEDASGELRATNYEETMDLILYRCPKIDPNTYYDLTPMPEASCEQMAEDAANDYYTSRWDCDWPIEISLHEVRGGPEIARFSVEMEKRPVFYAVKIELAEEIERNMK